MAHLDGEDLAAMECTSARFRALAKDDGAWRRLCERDDLVTRCSRPGGGPEQAHRRARPFRSWKHLYASAATDRRARRSAARESEYYRTRNRWLMALVNLDDAEAEEKRVREERRRVVENTTGRVERMLAGTVPIRDDRDGPEERAIRTGQDARARSTSISPPSFGRWRDFARRRGRRRSPRTDSSASSETDETRKRAWRVAFRPVDPDPRRARSETRRARGGERPRGFVVLV